ncbi:MAG: cell division protein FtsQ/DivIB [Bacillota bacterium]
MLKGKSPYGKRANQLKKVRKDYQRKNLNNPFFNRRKPQPIRTKSKSGFLPMTVTILLCTGFAYLLFFSPLFALKKITVQGVTRVSPEELSGYAWKQAGERGFWPFHQGKLIFFKTAQLNKSLSENFSFDSLRVYKKWPQTIVISAGERNLAFIWRDGQGNHFSDGQGCLIREAGVSNEQLAAYPILESADAAERLDSKDCLSLDADYLQAMFSLSDKMKAYPELKVERFLVEGEANTLKADLASGPNILFNVKDDPDKQLNKLIIIKQDKPAADFNRLEYIDLRYGDRAYFK